MANISAWEDDPLASPSVRPIGRPVPPAVQGAFAVSLRERKPPVARYEPGTRAFRYWNGLDALYRASAFFAEAAAPATQWHSGRELPVALDRGEDLNAYYDRQGLSFFHATVRGVTVYSGESPDVVCHELGHAVLDAVKPQLWNTACSEVDAFHESFGDIAAMLAALQLPSVRTLVIEQTGGRLSRASRLSRLAEQLGWAVRQIKPDAVDSDCLRNAVNSFFYREPESLPPTAPASSLSSEPHSFSRVFTAAWLDGFAAMSARAGASSAKLRRTARDAGRLLIEAVREARVAPNYFAQVAAHLLRAESRLFGGRDQDGLRQAFVRRGILSLESAAAVIGQLRSGVQPRGASPVDGAGSATIRIRLDAAAYGLRARAILVEAPIGSPRSVAAAAAPDLGSQAPRLPEDASRVFVEDLLKRRRLDPGVMGTGAGPGFPPGRATHALVRDGRDVRLVRRLFHFEGR